MTRPVIFRIRKSPDDGLETAPAGSSADLRSALPPELESSVTDADIDDRARMLLRPLKTQLSSSDARTDRLVRQLRNEIESIRFTLSELAEGHDDLLELDAAAVAEDPAAAATLPAPLLVRTIIRLEHERQVLEEESREKGNVLRALGDQHQELQLRESTARARLETLEDVIAALHANLEDLRLARSLLDHRSPAAQQLPAAGHSPAE